MRVVIDIEADGLDNPTHIWVIVCKDIDTGDVHVFREPTTDRSEADRFRRFALGVDYWIGHNILGYDLCVLLLHGLISRICPEQCLDTLIISKLMDYSRDGHSLADYGVEFGLPKDTFSNYSSYSIELENRCITDVSINHRVYLRYLKYITQDNFREAIALEHKFQTIVNNLSKVGFSFNVKKAKALLKEVESLLSILDAAILAEFPPKPRLVREIHPRLTKHGTLNKSDFRFVKDGDLSPYSGGPFSLITWQEFNPSSHKQLIEVLTQAGWKPEDKTKTHIEIEREYNKLKHSRSRTKELDLRLTQCYDLLQSMMTTGWKINEHNLSTLPPNAPAPARTLAKRILLESRRRTLTEWLSLVRSDTGRIHGSFYGIGAWTHRMAHQKPNTANIPTPTDLDGNPKLYGAEMRQLWQAPRNRLLVGVDAEGIQLRIFAHYIDDAEFTRALVEGNKEDGSDPHSLNQRILGSVCKSRAASKRFIYALLLGAGMGKLAEILGCSRSETEQALNRLLERYDGFAYLKSNVIPSDARRGWFTGIDGRSVKIPGDTQSYRAHLAMSGYLQNGEQIIIKTAALSASEKLTNEKVRFDIVDIVHDEYVIETPNDVDLANYVKDTFCQAIVDAGVKYKLKCPLAGDGHIGLNWKDIH